MLDLRKYSCLGEALRDALGQWPDEICLIEADRERENLRLTYRQFKEIAHPLARALQDANLQNGSRAAIIMTNQSKWLISAYAIFFGGGVLVPLDYKLSAAEQLKLLSHSKAEFLIIEYHLWRAIDRTKISKTLPSASSLFPRTSLQLILPAQSAGKNFITKASQTLYHASRSDMATIVYSSGTGGGRKAAFLPTATIWSSVWLSRLSILSGRECAT